MLSRAVAVFFTATNNIFGIGNPSRDCHTVGYPVDAAEDQELALPYEHGDDDFSGMLPGNLSPKGKFFSKNPIRLTGGCFSWECTLLPNANFNETNLPGYAAPLPSQGK